MPEKPLIFCTELIPRLLDDTKTMTRRINRKFKKGDLIWVKETWVRISYPDGTVARKYETIYKANDNSGYPYQIKWKSSRFMPKKYARIWLEVLEDSWRERLQDISAEDCFKEGTEDVWTHKLMGSPYPIEYIEDIKWSFFDMWDRLGGKKHPWESNPEVWVTEFRRVM